MQKGILFQSAMGHQSHIEEVQHMLHDQHQPIENPKQ